MLSHEDIKALVAAHTPVMYMHPADKFMPCSAEWFMQRSCLEAAQPSSDGQVRQKLVLRSSVSKDTHDQMLQAG